MAWKGFVWLALPTATLIGPRLRLGRSVAPKVPCDQPDVFEMPKASVLFLVAMPGAPSSFWLLVASQPGAPSSVLAPSSDALCNSWEGPLLLLCFEQQRWSLPQGVIISQGLNTVEHAWDRGELATYGTMRICSQAGFTEQILDWNWLFFFLSADFLRSSVCSFLVWAV